MVSIMIVMIKLMRTCFVVVMGKPHVMVDCLALEASVHVVMAYGCVTPRLSHGRLVLVGLDQLRNCVTI